MNRYLAIVLTILFATVATLIALFWIQNSGRTTGLSLNLGFLGAWELAREVGVPALITASFGSGFLLGAFLFLVRSMSLKRQNQRLQQELALSGGDKKSQWP
jgi:uncharacterized integral membrane protein